MQGFRLISERKRTAVLSSYGTRLAGAEIEFGNRSTTFNSAMSFQASDS